MPKGKLSPEGEVIAAYGAAMVATFQVLINCLEENDALLPGQFPAALGVYMEMERRDICSASRDSDRHADLDNLIALLYAPLLLA
jgi:hypothetical protein